MISGVVMVGGSTAVCVWPWASKLGPSWTNMERVSDQPARWSQATVYPDMWADPNDDPRNSEGVSPDGELATLQD